MTMHPYPHRYLALAAGASSGTVTLASAGLPDLTTAPPPEFDGPGGVWSPETLLCGAIADCFVLSFRGVSRAAKFEWIRLECEVEGRLERLDNVTRFTSYTTRATLTVAPGSDEAKAKSLLERAEHVCLVSNSLNGVRALETHIIIA